MADLPFGFSAGDDPDRDKHGKDPESGDPGDFDFADLGQLFTKLGQMFSGAGSAMSSGKASGPVNYDLARRLASSAIG
ncbi:MAG TPA: zinc-dependent metalloprotease, partial [Mycobacterium sp.]|nr:zinc-dependent metalloprotease [Mycobacterium sp.]